MLWLRPKISQQIQCVRLWQFGITLKPDKSQKVLNIPKDSDIKFFDNGKSIIVYIKQEIKTSQLNIPSGSLIETLYENVKKENTKWKTVFTPHDGLSLEEYIVLGSKLLVVLKNYKQDFLVKMERDTDGFWKEEKVDLGDNLSIGVESLEDEAMNGVGNGDYQLTTQSWLSPFKVEKRNIENNSVVKVTEPFDSGEIDESRIKHFNAISEDEEEIPYVVLLPENYDSGKPYPTLFNAYGAFGTATRPIYSVPFDSCWVEEGGVVVIGMPRGGGEKGEDWHKAGRGDKKIRLLSGFRVIPNCHSLTH